ncbi:hypothetical protein CONCODRAFT_70788 [Conidiobolus coronatus NRRL 28638]|uniref:F-box domain-containing protein n=1 Tax=Conidiobolus coronatus (strain ATCC 28846 / CBS 209.66 / NRRL 28638) TaxID=796925 RepID=A0A137P5P6_CONC2|nr:hypothetical protein CONCODRAFT_70788 [Conidiobolus coronatus NRRL 28638]|eukprot:KXN70325.1 hypothetical protein CONCODRAFT_70788 [Conidiobolus coronatus NRRL 28638]
MKDSNWIIIFRLKEFSNYFTKDELIQLSLGCKVFRSCLSRYIFNSFNFRSFTDIGKYNDSIISDNEHINDHNRVYIYNPFKPLDSDLTKSKAQFNLDLKLFPNQPMELVVQSAEYYYHILYDIPNVFTKLTTVIISHSILQCELFQDLLNNLDCLNSLELSNSSLIQFTKSSDITPIEWPSSLKRLKVCNNKTVRVEDRQKNIILVNGRVQSSSNGNLTFTLKHLPKLTSFEYQLLFLQFDDENLWEFLKLNSQIKNLIIRVPDFHPELFAAIQCIDNLSVLHLKFMIYNTFEVDYNNLPILNNITSLTITLYDKPDINNIIIDKFPNLAELTVEIDSKDTIKLATMTKKLSNVKNLNLKITFQRLKIKKFVFPKLDNLYSLEFILDNGIYLNDIDWNFDSCSNLKLVKFSKAESKVYMNLPKMNPELIDNWKAVYSLIKSRIIEYKNKINFDFVSCKVIIV